MRDGPRDLGSISLEDAGYSYYDTSSLDSRPRLIAPLSDGNLIVKREYGTSRVRHAGDKTSARLGGMRKRSGVRQSQR
jgi:hypothetical protein